jgi:hypothetical protein
MKKRAILFAACVLLISVSLAQATPLPRFQVNDTSGRSGSGGPFQILGVDSFFPANYQTYCIETGENITIGHTYWGTIDNVAYYSSSLSYLVSAPIAAGTSKLYNYFLDNQSTLSNTAKYDIQIAIWKFQGQSLGEANWYYNHVGDLVASNRTVYALNLWNADVGGPTYNNPGDFAQRAQSMLYTPDGGTSVPEPSVLILLGLGLIGVAGIRRKFKA